MNKLLMYSDESCYIQNDGTDCMSLATIYLNSINKREIVSKFKEIIRRYGVNGEIKWNKVSPGNVDMYKEIILTLHGFVEKNQIRVRTLLAIGNKTMIQKKYSEWYDSMYYYLFRKIVDDKIVTKNIHLLIDRKDTHSSQNVKKIASYLENYSLWSKNVIASAENSKDHTLIQIADVIAGATSYKFRELNTSAAKKELISFIENTFHTNLIEMSLLKELKFNIFVWRADR